MPFHYGTPMRPTPPPPAPPVEPGPDLRPRVIVTGSRVWMDEAAVRTALTSAWRNLGQPIIVVHGACTDRNGQLRGADRWADEWATEHAFAGITAERHPADWSQGRSAGPSRNRRMVHAGAVLALAFPLGESRGTRGCVDLCERAGIPVVVTEGATT